MLFEFATGEVNSTLNEELERVVTEIPDAPEALTKVLSLFINIAALVAFTLNIDSAADALFSNAEK